MRKIFLDIETLPPDEETGEAIRKLQTCEDKEFRDLALKAEKGRVLTIGVIIEEDGTKTVQGLFGRDAETGRFHLDEARALRSFWNYIGPIRERRDLLIGHNILDFDLPFLLKRSIINRIKPAVISFRRYQDRPIYDTMWQWSLWRYRISLGEVAETLGLCSPKTDEIDGSKAYDHFLAGRHEEIARYCMRDVECTREIYYRLKTENTPELEPYIAWKGTSPNLVTSGQEFGLAA